MTSYVDCKSIFIHGPNARPVCAVYSPVGHTVTLSTALEPGRSFLVYTDTIVVGLLTATV